MKPLCLAAAILISLSLTACAGGAGPSSPAVSQPAQSASPSSQSYTFTDDLGRSVTAPRSPQRVAAMIGSFADVWCLAGGGDSLVAAAHDAWTSFDSSTYDDATTLSQILLQGETADLGAVKEPNLEVLLAAQPDFILASCNTASNLELEDTFAQVGIPTAYFDIQSFDDYLNMLEICTTLTGCPENYQTYGLDVQEQVEAAVTRQDGSAPTVLTLRATGSSCKIKGSRDFLLGEMLADLGCVNVADSDEGLLENLSLEAILAADPDYIFAVLQGSDASDAQETLEKTLLTNPAWANLRAVQEGNFYTLEHSLYNLKPNARWGESYEKLADILYP